MISAKSLIKNRSTVFLKLVIGFIGAIALAVCFFVLPGALLHQDAGGYRPILIVLYIAAIPFFVALFQGLKLLDYIDQNRAFSLMSVHALQIIKRCGYIIAGLFTAIMPLIYWMAEIDDAPGVLALGLVIVFASSVIAVFAAVLAELMQNAMKIKSENDLTV